MILADSNVLLRLLQRANPMHPDALHAIRILQTRRELVVAPQNTVELWVVATRPIEQNGLEMSPSHAASYPSRLNRAFAILTETPDLQQEWQRLVIANRMSGKKAHDTRLVAIMRVHGIGRVLTFNADDFRRYSGIEVVHPRNVQ